MPEYALGEKTVQMIDLAYSRFLMKNTSLLIVDVLAVDRVQKHLPIPDDAARHLRREGLIEGRKPRYHVSAVVADATASRADYILTRPQDDEHYARLLMDFLKKFGAANRNDLEKLLLKNLSGALNEKQKHQKLSNLLTKLRRSGHIRNAGSNKNSRWEVAQDAE